MYFKFIFFRLSHVSLPFATSRSARLERSSLVRLPGCQVATEHLVRYFYIQTQMLILVKSKCENNWKQIHWRRQATTGRSRGCLIVFGGSPQRQWLQCSRSLAPSPWPCSWDPLASLPETLDLLAALPTPSSFQGSTQRQRRTLGDFTNLSNCTNKPILLWSSDWH